MLRLTSIFGKRVFSQLTKCASFAGLTVSAAFLISMTIEGNQQCAASGDFGRRRRHFVPVTSSTRLTQTRGASVRWAFLPVKWLWKTNRLFESPLSVSARPVHQIFGHGLRLKRLLNYEVRE